ncbi:hypothetical protein [Oribacterium sp. FC2011]|uniref:hypothetical protein n=1 Tax=Oribacterium sp. FC2011 TaxID=1408311 RepID=UPI0004E1CCDE|nr:hypothetical protein [Oribacterium sp. FC2011]
MKITKDSIMFQNGTYKLNNGGSVVSDGDPVQALETISLEAQAAIDHLNKDYDVFPSSFLYVDGSKDGVSIQVVNESDDTDLVSIYMGDKIVEVGSLKDIIKGLVDDIELHEDALLKNFHDTAEEPYMRNRIEDAIKRLMDEPVTKRPFFTVIDGDL